jgi:transposase InsO family protein
VRCNWLCRSLLSSTAASEQLDASPDGSFLAWQQILGKPFPARRVLAGSMAVGPCIVEHVLDDLAHALRRRRLGCDEPPRYLIRDRDGAYGAAFIRRIRAMGIRDRPVSARSPWQNGYADRLIGSIRRECLDRVRWRAPSSPRSRIVPKILQRGQNAPMLQKDARVGRDVCRTGRVRSSPILGGLY